MYHPNEDFERRCTMKSTCFFLLQVGTVSVIQNSNQTSSATLFNGLFHPQSPRTRTCGHRIPHSIVPSLSRRQDRISLCSIPPPRRQTPQSSGLYRTANRSKCKLQGRNKTRKHGSRRLLHVHTILLCPQLPTARTYAHVQLLSKC